MNIKYDVGMRKFLYCKHYVIFYSSDVNLMTLSQLHKFYLANV
jgi:hypothetical protein